MKKCPFCAEEIQDEAIFCRYCHHDLPSEVHKDSDLKKHSSNQGYQPKEKKKQWSVFWVACSIGLVFTGGVWSYKTSHGVTNFNDIFFSAFSNFIVTGGAYCLIVWIKRAFVKHDLDTPKFSRYTGFSSLMFFGLLFCLFLALQFDIFSKDIEKNQSNNQTSNYQSTPKSSNCHLKQKGFSYQISFSGNGSTVICNQLKSTDLGIYSIDAPMDAEVICEYIKNDITATVREVLSNSSTSQEICGFLSDLSRNSDLTFKEFPLYLRGISDVESPTKSECVQWSLITTSDKGKTMCVYGSVRNSYFNENLVAYIFDFSSDPTAFYFIKHGNITWGNMNNQCIQATGKIDVLFKTPYMEIPGDLVYYCD